MRVNDRRLLLIFLVLFVAIGLFATSAVARPGLGTADTPIMLSVGAEEGFVEAAEEMAVALEIATGLHFDVEVIEDWRRGVDWLCDDFPDRGLRMMQAPEYVVAKDECAAKTSMALRRFGQDGARGEFLVPADSGLSSLADLAGLDWYYSGEGSFVSYLFPLYMLNEAGVEGYTPISAGTHQAAVEAVYNNAVDPLNPPPVFATVFFDARSSIAGDHPDVWDKVSILELTPSYPGIAAVFGPRFPDSARNQIEDLLEGFSHETHPAHWVWEDNFGVWPGYASDGWIKVNWKDFHFLKDVMTATGFEF